MKRGMWRTLLVGLVAVVVPVGVGGRPAGHARRIRSRARCRSRAVSTPRSAAPATGSRNAPQIQMTQRSNDGIWSITLALPAGSYEYKAALDKSFNVNYGKGAVQGRTEHSDHGAGRRQECHVLLRQHHPLGDR